MTADPKTFREVFDEHNEKHVALNLSHLARLMELMPPDASALEIGCFKGGTTVWLLEHGIARIDVVDPFTGNREHQGFVDCSKIEEEFDRATESFKDRIGVSPCQSSVALPRLLVLGAAYDFIYVDGSHDSQDAILDAVLAFHLLKPGGVMVFDDYEWNIYEDQYRTPKPAIDFFLASYADKITVLEKHYQVSIRKL